MSNSFSLLSSGVSFRQYVSLASPLQDQSRCNSEDHYNGLVRGKFVCAESGGCTVIRKNESIKITGNSSIYSPRQGDYGAPLLCRRGPGSPWSLSGVLTREGGNCVDGEDGEEGVRSHPDVYAAVSGDWIR